MRHLPLAAFASLLLAAPAAADVVDPEPDSCPPGSRPSTAHSGPYCAPTGACTSDAECASGTCDAIMQCVETRSCGGRTIPDAEPCTLDHVVGPCASDGTCEVGECRMRSVCEGASSDGCSCRAAGAPGSSGAPLAIGLGLALGLVARRRRAQGAR